MNIASIPHLLKIEWLKFKSNTVVLLLVILYTLLAPVLILGVKDVIKDLPPPLPGNQIFYEFPTVWDYQGYTGNWLLFIFIGFIGIFIITNEVSFKTMRQNIITGLTRNEFFLSKVSVILVISLYTTLIYYVSCLIIGLTHTPGADLSLILDNNWAGLRYFIMSMGYLSFGLMLGFILRRGALAIFLYMAYVLFIEMIIKWGTILLAGYWASKSTSVEAFFEKGSKFLNFINYLPLNTIEDLQPNPLLITMDHMIDLQDKFNLKIVLSNTSAMIGGTCMVLLFLFLAYRSFMKRDI